jgi:hypothetical protein
VNVTYTATLPVSEDTVLFVSGLLHAERRRPGTGAGTRALGCYRQAILVLRWLLDGTRIAQLAADNTIRFKKPKNRSCTTIEQQFNRAHNAVRAIGERGNSLLKTTFKALRNVSPCPWSITRITAAALVILHIEHGRTT